MNDWVSVKDRLPELSEEVIGLAKSKDGKFSLMVHCQYVGEDLSKLRMSHYPGEHNPFSVKRFCEGNYFSILPKGEIQNPFGDIGHSYFGEVTHWLPIPKLPEQR